MPTVLPKIGVVAEIFPLEGAKVFDKGIFKVHSTSAANRTWLAFVPFCRFSFNNCSDLCV